MKKNTRGEPFAKQAIALLPEIQKNKISYGHGHDLCLCLGHHGSRSLESLMKKDDDLNCCCCCLTLVLETYCLKCYENEKEQQLEKQQHPNEVSSLVAHSLRKMKKMKTRAAV